MNDDEARIRYDVTMEDLVAFNQNYIKRSPLMRRQIAIGRLLGVGLVFIAAVILIYILDPSSNGFIASFAAAVGAATYAWMHGGMVRRRIRNMVSKIYKEGANRTSLGWHELQLAESGFIERTDYNENKTAWGAVERIETEDGYTFIYVGAAFAYIIPHAKVSDGNLPLFLKELGRRYHPDATLSPPITPTSLPS